MLQCGHSNWDTLEEDCPITMFSGNKRPSSFFFVNWPITFKAQLHNCWKLSNPLQFMNFIGLFAKNLKIICFRKCCDWAIFFQVTCFKCPHCKFVRKKKKDQYLSSSFTRGTCRISCPRFCPFSITSVTYHLCSCCYVFVATFGCFHEWQVQHILKKENKAPFATVNNEVWIIFGVTK